jgi:Transcriptional regulatory protein, C terminal
VLIRLFRGVIREGAEDRLIRKLHDGVLPWLDACPGVVSATLAFPLDGGTPREYLVESKWRGVDDLIRFLGDDWRTPRVEQGEEELLVSVSAHHFVADPDEPRARSDERQMPTDVWLDHIGIEGHALRVVWNGSSMHLPPREMAAMLALASRAGTPVSTSELARHIWPGSALVGPYDVRRVIHRLRSLVRSTDVPIDIRNVHGRGYLVEPAVAPPPDRGHS